MSTLVTTALRHNASASNNIVLDSSGRVGIGTATPTTQLTIQGTGSSIEINQNVSSIRFSSSPNRTNNWYVGANISDSVNGGVVVGSGNDVSSGTARMVIDAGGRVTIPAQPMFMGFPTNDYSTGSMPTGVIPFTASYNNGSHYNAGTSRFTAPVTGWYRTTWGGLQLAGTVVSLQVNGTRVYNGNHFNVSTPTYITMTQTVLRTLNAGDFLTIEGWNGGGYFRDWYLWSVELVA